MKGTSARKGSGSLKREGEHGDADKLQAELKVLVGQNKGPRRREVECG